MDFKEIRAFIMEDVIAFHNDLEKDFVVKSGIKDLGLLDSAVNNPFQTFGSEELYPSIFDKAAQLCYGIANNHGFTDGNKRTAVHSMEVYLDINDIIIDYDEEEMENIIVSVAAGNMTSKKLADWLKEKEIKK
ncbi:type II toxin-antitoxin system death-on-curing family toxin [Pectinatus brassicae]|uniref:Death-on-curing protein n=1 Tax=Pectinatus brassicae TaxID=862415 RepID=A0A840UTG6_9FIRM|nr:type II toxin-antitoxin system death-on-curing family toxin [Pectinatus brassicae]MBB5336253.1 death-on-curing protein [Pectinatus brassicae]